MSTENTREKRLKYIFNQHPNLEVLHITSDDAAFTELSTAKNHAKTLTDKNVETEKRSDYVSATAKTADVKDADKEKDDAIMRHKQLFGQLPAKTAKLETILKKIGDEEKRLANIGKAEGKSFVVTQDYLDANPDLTDVKIGDTITLPAE